MATQTEIGRHLDLTQGAVSQFLADAGIERTASGYDLDAVRIAYIRRIREKAAGRSGDDAKLNLAEERAKLAVLQAEAWEIKNQKALGELLPRQEVGAAVTNAFARVRARLLAIPPRASPQLATMSSPVEVQAKLTDFVHEALAELAGTETVYAPDAGPASQGSASGGGLVEGAGPAAEIDGQPMGGCQPGTQLRGKRRTRKVGHKPG